MRKKELITTTAQWSLVVHRVTDTSAEIWVGTLFPTSEKTSSCSGPTHSARWQYALTRQIVKAEWKRPFNKVNQRFYTICSFQNLKPGTRYRVRFSRRIEAIRQCRPTILARSPQWDIRYLAATHPTERQETFYHWCWKLFL